MTVSNQDVKKKSFIHKIFITKEKEGSGSSDFLAPLQALEVFAQIGAQKHQILWNKWSHRSRLHCTVAAQDPVGLDLPLEDDVVLIVVTSATVPNKGFGSQAPTIVSVAKRI